MSISSKSDIPAINLRFKEIRLDRNLSQEKYGELLGGITKSAVSRIESGKNGVSEQNITALCRELNVNPGYLRYGIGSMYLPSDELFKKNLGRVAKEKNKFKQFYLNMLMQFPDEYWDHIHDEFKKFESEQ